MKKERNKSRAVLFLAALPLIAVMWFVSQGAALSAEETPAGPSAPAVQDDPYLILVNRAFAIGEAEFETAGVYGVIPAQKSNMRLNPTALEALAELFAEARALGYTEFYLVSGFRDYAEQAMLYENAEDKSFVQPAGHSEHHTGLAADIAYLGESMYDFDQSEYGQWFTANAHRYGFILRYPADKTVLTGISYEPWHFRYVGVSHATAMYENNLCLEEYVNSLV